MKTALRFLPFLLLGCGFVGLFGLLQLRKDPPSKDREQLDPLVETVQVSRCNDGFHLRIDGEVIPYREISLATQVRGRIEEKTPQARAGRYVRKGDLLFQIDPQDYELELRRLQETVKEAGSSIEESDIEKSNVKELIELAKDQLALQRSEVARFENLRQRNAASDSQLESTRNAELRSLNALQTLKNQTLLIDARRNRLAQEKERALTNLELARLNLSRTKIASPIDGIVIQDLAEEDDYVQTGASLVQLEDTSKVEVRFSLRMEKLRWLWTAADTVTTPTPRNSYALPRIPVRVHVDIGGHHFSWTATLDRYDGAGINAATRTAPIIAVVDDPTAVKLVRTDKGALPLPAPPTLLRGTFVTVEIPVGAAYDLVTVPTIALRPGGRVWALREGKLNIEPVNVAHSTDDEVILLTNRLAVGDQVITSPLPLVVDGMQLRTEPKAESKEATVAASDTNKADAL